MSELLGEAVLQLDADLGPLDRKLVEAEAKVAAAMAAMQRMMDRDLGAGLTARLSAFGPAFDQQLTSPLARFGATADKMGKQVDGSLAQVRIEQAATIAEMEKAAATARAVADAQVTASQRVARAYAEEAAAAKLAADSEEAAARKVEAARRTEGGAAPFMVPGAAGETQKVIVQHQGEHGGGIMGIKGPGGGTIANPVCIVVEAASRTGMGSMAAAIGEAPVSGGAATTTIAEGGGGQGATTVMTQSSGGGSGGRPPVVVAPSGGGHEHGGGGGAFIPMPWWLGGSRHIGGGGGGGGGLLGGGIAGGLLGLGSIGSFAGFDIAHVLMTALGLAGSAAGGAVGAGLLGLGAAGTMGVGLGSDMGVMKSTIADTKTLAEGYKKVSEAVFKYGKESEQAQLAQRELNGTMKELGNTAGVQAEVQLAKASEALNMFWDKATSTARVRAVEVLKQLIGVGTTFVPLVARAAEQNLSIINQGIKPLFAWLQGSQGLTLWNKLEDIFRTNLPTSIKAGTQAIEFFGRLTGIAAEHTGGLMNILDRLFSRLNAMSNPQIGNWVTKFINDFKMWAALIKVVGEDIFFLFRNDAGTATAIVTGITHALEKLREWEKSARGSAQLQNIFIIHKEQIEALGKAIVPLIKAFGQLYMAIAPTAVEASIIAITKVITPMAEALADVAKSGEAAALAMGILLVSWKAFGLGGTVNMLKGAFGWLTGAEKAQAAAATADAGAQAGLAGTSVAGGAAAGGAARGLPALGARAAGGVESGALGLGGILESIGLGGAASAVVSGGGGLGALIRTVASKALPLGAAALAVGASVDKGIHSSGQNAGFGSDLAGFFSGGLVGNASASPVGLVRGLFGGQHAPVEIKSMGEAAHQSAKRIGELVKEIERAHNVKIAGIGEPWKAVAEQLRKAQRAQEDWNSKFNESWELIHKFALGTGPVLRELYERFNANFRNIATTMGATSAQGTKLARENVDQMVNHVLGALHHGQIGTKEAMSAISNAIHTYSAETGDKTPKIYEDMFSRITTLEKRHEIGTKTAYSAYRQIASSETKATGEEVVNKTRETKEHVEKEQHEGILTTTQAQEDLRKINKETSKRVEASMQGMAESIVSAMEAGALSTKDGSGIIEDNLNAALVKFGAKPLSKSELKAYVGRTELNTKLGKVQQLMGFGAAQGTMLQIGQAGERGPDSIPMNIGGQPVMVAPGEVATVFNRHQLPYVNAGLEGMGFEGGLHGLFSTVTTPHNMAEGGFVGRMVAEANKINAAHFPYSWGGGHNSSFSGPYDCSGAVSAVLHAAGVLNRPEVSGELASFGAPGPGAVTIYANPVHTFMSIMGKFFGTHGSEGAGWYQGSALPGFTVRHVPLTGGEALGQFGSIGAPHVHGIGTMSKLVQAGLNKEANAASAYLEQHALPSTGLAAGPGGANVGHLVPGIMNIERQAAAIAGLPFNANIVAALLQHESSGGVNEPPSGSLSATGPNQVIPSTFAAYSIAGHKEISNPLDNAIASMRYIKAKYGSLQHMAEATGLLTGGYKGYAAGGFIGAQHGLHVHGPHAHVASLIKAKGHRKVTHPKAGKRVTLSSPIMNLEKIPGWGHLASELGGPSGAYNTLVDEQNLLGGMTGNAASLLHSDMVYLNPTLLPGENLYPGMKVPQAEHVLQHLLVTNPESEALQLQGSILSFLGGLDTHRLLSEQDIGVLAKDFKGGTKLTQGEGVFVSQQRVIEAQVGAQRMMAAVMKREIKKAAEFIKLKEKRKKVIERLLHATYKRYANVQKQIEEISRRALVRALTAAQRGQVRAERQSRTNVRIRDARAQEVALGDAISAEQAMPPWERNRGLMVQWENEKRHIGAYIGNLQSFEGESTKEAHERVVTAGEALHASQLKGDLKPLEESLTLLGGDATKIGTSGELGVVTKQIASLHSGAIALEGKYKESVEVTQPNLALNLANLKVSLQEQTEQVVPGLGPGKAEAEKAEAAKKAEEEAAATTKAAASTELTSLLKTQNEQLAQQLAVSQAQYKVLANLAPFGGKFHSGGVVPGPLGAERMILAQGGEVVLPAGGSNVNVNVADGMGWLKRYIDVRVQEGTRGMARNAGRRLPSAGGGQF